MQPADALEKRVQEARSRLGAAIALAEAAVNKGAGLELAALRLKKAQAAADTVIAEARGMFDIARSG